MPRISSKNQVTLPVSELASAGLAPGDDVVIVADQRGRLVIQRREQDLRALFAGLDLDYPADYLRDLRAGERF